MTTLHHLYRLRGNIATVIIARHLLRAGKPLSLKEIHSPSGRKQTEQHLELLMSLGLVERAGIDGGPVAGSGRRPMLYKITDTGRFEIERMLTE